MNIHISIMFSSHNSPVPAELGFGASSSIGLISVQPDVSEAGFSRAACQFFRNLWHFNELSGTSSKQEVFSKTKNRPFWAGFALAIEMNQVNQVLELRSSGSRRVFIWGSRQREVVSISRSKVFMCFVCCLLVELNGNHHIKVFERLHHQLFVSTTLF